nr:Alpha-glucosidase 1 [Colletotrichum truncatum]KAF6799154.1 Alpha-glucosidase 1 [Colletotrichum truncatum]
MNNMYMRRAGIGARGLRSTLSIDRKVALTHRAPRPPNATPVNQKSQWWKDAVVYQIYVPSFKDTNGDGYGDLRGIIEKLEYKVDLGVDVIWLSPIFDSPLYDMGYDISDYYKINPMFGDMEDFNNLLKQAHGRGLRVILDIALNHTSSKHAWFKKSIAAEKGEANGFKDFYIWGNPIVDESGNKRPPSNWESVFEGCMWEWVPEIRKYYLHVFGREQPDLNWYNADVRRELWKVLRFWLDKGVDGFRLDAINCMSKVHNEDLCAARPGQPTVSGWPDAPTSTPGRFEQKTNEMFANGPRVHKYLQEMQQEVFAHYDALSLGEMSCGITPELGRDFISHEAKELDLILHFEHVELDCVNGDKWTLRDWKLPELKAAVSKWQTCMAEAGGWDTLWFENHDQPRGLNRFCKVGQMRMEHAAKLLAMWLFTLRGTIIIYQGQELGLTNPEEFSEETIRDIETRIYWNAAHAALAQGDDTHKLEMVKKAIMTKGRDAARTPMVWDSNRKTSGGFTDHNAKPWLPAHPNFTTFCAEAQRRNPASVWRFYHDMIRFRQQHPGLTLAWQIYGVYQLVDEHHSSVFAYTRTHGRDIYLVVLNFGHDDHATQTTAGNGKIRGAKALQVAGDVDGKATTVKKISSVEEGHI